MQLQKTGYNNPYSSNKPSKTSFSNTSFGMKIIYDEEDVVSIVGKERAGVIKHTMEALEKKLIQRFQIIFKRSGKLQLLSKDVNANKFLNESRDISPATLIDNWYTLKLKPTFINENGRIVVELMDNQRVNEFGSATHPDLTMAAMMAFSNSLDAYSEKKIAIALVKKMKT